MLDEFKPLAEFMAQARANFTPDMVLPLALMFGMSGFCFYMALKVRFSNDYRYERLRRRAKSPKHVALGMVEPGENYHGGMAARHTPDGKIVIVRTNQITQTDLDELR